MKSLVSKLLQTKSLLRLRRLLVWLDRSSPVPKKKIAALGLKRELNTALLEGWSEMDADCFRITPNGHKILQLLEQVASPKLSP